MVKKFFNFARSVINSYQIINIIQLIMKSFLFYIIIVALALSFSVPISCAQNGEWTKRGLLHFEKAFFKRTPNKLKADTKKEYELAEKYFKKAIEANPKNVEPYLYLARTYFVQKKYRLAARVYKQALQIAPDRKDIYLKLASAFEMAGDYQNAIRTLEILKQMETDERAMAILNDLIEKLKKRANAEQNPGENEDKE